MFNYVTGEKLQELAEHTIVFNNQLNIRVASIQLGNTRCEYSLFNGFGDVSYLPDKILKSKSLFVYIYALDMFFDKIYPMLSNSFVLITHNSDYEINEKYEKYLNDGKIKRWYSQNVNLEHSKLISIPIGIANSQWEHGNLKLLDAIRNENNKKTNLVYKNFDINTSLINRIDAINDTKFIPMTRNRKQEDYLRDISMSKFNICPRGNGIDTHRMWESIYLGSIPIVPNCINNKQYDDLPILIINKWSEINNNFLNKKYEEIMSKPLDYKKIDLEYWRKEIARD